MKKGSSQEASLRCVGMSVTQRSQTHHGGRYARAGLPPAAPQALLRARARRASAQAHPRPHHRQTLNTAPAFYQRHLSPPTHMCCIRKHHPTALPSTALHKQAQENLLYVCQRSCTRRCIRYTIVVTQAAIWCLSIRYRCISGWDAAASCTMAWAGLGVARCVCPWSSGPWVVQTRLCGKRPWHAAALMHTCYCKLAPVIAHSGSAVMLA